LSFQDKYIQCADCQSYFICSAEDQERYQARGFSNDPKHCPQCRKLRKPARSSIGSSPLPLPPTDNTTMNTIPTQAIAPANPIPAGQSTPRFHHAHSPRPASAAPVSGRATPAGNGTSPNRRRHHAYPIQRPAGVTPPLAVPSAAAAQSAPLIITPSDKTFADFGLDPRVMAGVNDLGYVNPTPIQVQGIPLVMAGRDVIGLAQTGTGKTAAFALPLLHRLLPGPRNMVRALIVSPTRELAEQIYESIRDLGKHTGLRCMAIYGGVGMEQQINKLKSGYEIIVACPWRLLDHVWQGHIDFNHLEVLIIDEADRMFDMGFLPDIRNIVRCLPAQRQTLLFSATMPEDIRRLVREVLRDPVTVQVGLTRPASTVSHALYPVAQHLKTALLVELLRRTESDSVLVFTRTKHRAERVAEQLKRSGFRVAALQGNLSQNQRDRAMDDFKGGAVKIMVATDIAARGLDILSITHVVNFDMPDTADTYTHRIGRTGRVEQTGEAFTFITHEDEEMVRAIEKVLNSRIERRTIEGFDYNKPAPPRAEGSERPVRGRAPQRSVPGHPVSRQRTSTRR
jgi:ATP-dependent RNA helicase RhlE